MKRNIGWKIGIGYTLIFSLIMNPIRLAQGGASISVNAATGIGSATVDVIPPGLTGLTIRTAAISLPSASIPPASGYNPTYSLPLPTGANSASYARAKTGAGFVPQTSYSLKTTTGDTTADTNITSLVNIVPSDCATLTMESSTYLSNDLVSGTIVVDTAGTSGTGLLLRGYEFIGPPPTNSDGSINVDQIVQNGMLKFIQLLVGPFDLSTSNCNAIIIPFTTLTGYTNLYFFADGTSASNPINVTCPPGVVTVPCSGGSYPAIPFTGGCGGVLQSNYPPIGQLIGGTTNIVTATFTDPGGVSTNCHFLVYRQADAFNGFQSPIGGTGGTCTAPLGHPINRGSNTPIKFTDFCNAVNLTNGAPTLTISLVDTNTCTATLVTTGNFTQQSSVWHFNWDTSNLASGSVWQIVATLQDGSKQSAIVSLK